MAIKPRTVQEGKIMLLAENGGKVYQPRKEVWAVVPVELKLEEGAVVDIRGWNYVKGENRVWVFAKWKPGDKESMQYKCERFDRAFYLGQMVTEEYFPIANYLYDVRRVLRVRDKAIIRKIDESYKWREDDDKVWCSANARTEPYTPVVKPFLSLRKRLKLAEMGKNEV